MPTTSQTDTKLHYEDTGGDGRPVVLIHGWPLSGKAFKDNVPAYSDAGYRVITYDRRGFGESEAPATGYDYDQLADDLAGLMEELDLRDATLVGFSMGGGEVARYVAKHGESRLHSVVFASSVTPYMLQGGDNPDGPLEESQAAEMGEKLTADQDSFYDDFTTKFYSADGEMKATDQQKQELYALCEQANKEAALQCMTSFGATDFRADLPKVTVPALVIHGEADMIVPFDGSAPRTHEAVSGSKLVAIPDAPHGNNVTHRSEFDSAILDFLRR